MTRTAWSRISNKKKVCVLPARNRLYRRSVAYVAYETMIVINIVVRTVAATVNRVLGLPSPFLLSPFLLGADVELSEPGLGSGCETGEGIGAVSVLVLGRGVFAWLSWVEEVTTGEDVDDGIIALPLPNPCDSGPVLNTEDLVCGLSVDNVVVEVLDFCVELSKLRVVVLVLEVTLEVEEDSVSVLIPGTGLGRLVRGGPGVRGSVSNSARSSWRQRIWIAGPTVACALPVRVAPQTPPRKSDVSDVQVWPLQTAGSQFG